MKKALITISTMALLSAAVPQANAGGGAIAAGVVGGLGAGLLIGSALQPRPVYVAPAPVIVQPPPQVIYSQPVTTVQQPVAVQQQPVVVQQQPVVVQQPQVVYAPAPVYYAPAPYYYGPPVVSLGFSFGHPYYRHYRHW